MGSRLHPILLVEDDINDVRFIMRAVHGLTDRHSFSFRVVDNSAQVYDMHCPPDRVTAAYLPDLILLDLALPKRDGKQVLAEICTDKVLKRLPIVIVTASEADPILFQTYALCAPCYIHKSDDLQRFTRTVQEVVDYWLTVADRQTNEDSASPESSA